MHIQVGSLYLIMKHVGHPLRFEVTFMGHPGLSLVSMATYIN